MILSKLAAKWLEWIIEIALWITLVGAFLGGLKMGSGFFGSIIMAIVLTAIAGVFAALVFGAFIILADIRNSVTAIEKRSNGG